MTWLQLVAASLAWWQIALVGGAGILVVAFAVMMLFETSVNYRESGDRAR